MGSLIRRRERTERNRRISAAVIGIAVALLSLATLAWVPRSARAADEPPPRKPPGIFSGVGGWIVYGDQRGIWAVDPSHPGDPGNQVQLSHNRGTPLTWVVVEFGYAASGPWNPLVQLEPEVAEAPVANERSTPAPILLPVAALLTLVVGFVLLRRRRRAPGA